MTEPSRPSLPAANEAPTRARRAGRFLLGCAGKLMLTLFSTLLLLAAGEGLVRWRYPEYGIPVFTTKLFTEFDPVLGWRKIPNFHGTHVQEEYTIVEQFNSRGLRGPEYPYAKPDGEYRILVLGDSFAEGYTVEFEDLFSQILEKGLREKLGRRVEVINAGTGGYSTDQELLFFRTEGRKYAPDLVVVMYCENDTAMNIKPYYNTWDRGQKPLFQLENGRLSLKSSPQKTWDRNEEAAKDGAGREHEYKQAFVFWKPETWFLHRFYKHVTGHRPVDLPPAEPTPPPALESGVAGDDYRGGREEWAMTEALLGQLRAEAADIGAHTLLFHIPGKGDVHGGRAPDHTAERNLRLACRRGNIPFVPALDAFCREASLLAPSGRRLYWVKDSHWTPEGHRLAAQILEKAILERRGELGAGPAAGAH